MPFRKLKLYPELAKPKPLEPRVEHPEILKIAPVEEEKQPILVAQTSQDPPGGGWKKILLDEDPIVALGSQTQALLQRATTYDLIVQLRSAGVEIDPRSIRALVKTSDELYSVLRTDTGVAYDARDRNWTVTETVPISHANLDVALSLIKAKTDNLDVALSTRLKIADFVLTQELGKVGIILSAGGAIIDPRNIRALTSADVVSAVKSGTWNIDNLLNPHPVSLASIPKTLRTAKIDHATLGDNTIVFAVLGKRIKVYAVTLVVTAAVNVIWKSGATALSGDMNFGTKGEGYAQALSPPAFLMATVAGEALILNLSAAVAVDGIVSYWDDDSS